MPEAPRGAAPADSRLKLVLVLGSLTAFGPLSIDMYLPGLPALGRDLDAHASAVQLTLTACLAGLAIGQVLAGPVSDRLGRRRPLLAGVAAYAVVSALCALAPSIEVLIGLRFLQGLAGAAGIVIARAIVRDLYSGDAVARFFSLLLLITGAAPIFAPLVGAQLLHVTDWRGVFVVLAGIGALLLAMAAFGLRETLPPERRRTGGLAETTRTFGMLATDRHFLGYALACGLAFAAMFAYIAGSPFVLQDIYGASPQLFSLMFAVNGLGIVVVGQINGRLIGRFSPRELLRAGLIATAVGGAALLAVVAIGGLGVVPVLITLFVVVSSIGLVLPNATALALADHPEVSGAASGFLGVLQFVIGAIAAPLVGIAGTGTALPMALVIAALGTGALVLFATLTRTRPDAGDQEPAASSASPVARSLTGS